MENNINQLGNEVGELVESNGIQLSALDSKTQFAESKGRKIAYRIIGKGEPMILNCRFRGNLDTWDPAFIDALAENYQVIIFDYSGFGLSTGKPPENLREFTQDVLDLKAYLKLEKIIIGGWSFGGLVAQMIITEFPDYISHGILIGTKPPGNVPYSFEQIFLDTAYKPVNDLDDEIILFFEPTSPLSIEKAGASHDRIFSRKEDLDIPIAPELWANYGLGFEEFSKDVYNTKQKLMESTIPILVISSNHEVCFPPENWFELNRKLPTTQVVVIPQSGHGVQHQYPEMVASYIHNFVQYIKY
ncbi:MAG: alpha/beta hydrolase [Thalassobius sp.]|nr:alpha/beta hydrolase [Thalassovita sp.]